jgi:hypothetical protein
MVPVRRAHAEPVYQSARIEGHMGMRKLILVASVLAASGAVAQGLPKFEFRGLTVSSTAAQHQSILNKCEAYFNAQGCKLKDANVAGVLAFPEAMFQNSDGQLMEIRGTIARYNYATLEQGFIDKWGKPSERIEQEVQNGFGAKLTIPINVWTFEEGKMTLTGPDFRGQGSWHFRTHQRQAYLDGLEKPKKDF